MRIGILLGLVLLLAAFSNKQPPNYHFVKFIPLASEGTWGYVSIDTTGRRAFIAHNATIDVLDMDSGRSVGTLKNIEDARRVAVAPELGYGFATSRGKDRVSVFDLKTLAITDEIKTSAKPSRIVYDSATQRIFIFNGANSVNVADAPSAKVIATVALNGKPEFAVADGHGQIFVNLENTNETLAINTKSMKITARWNIYPCQRPSGLAMDKQNSRLFIACNNSMLTILNAKNGHVIRTIPVGKRVDTVAFDATNRELIASTRDDKLTVYAQDDADHYRIAQQLNMPGGLESFGVDEKTGQLFVPTANFEAYSGHPSPLTRGFITMILKR